MARLGVCGVLLMGGADCSRKNVSGPYLDNIEIVAQVAENVIMNRRAPGYKTALEVAENILNALHLWKPASVNEVLVAADDALRLIDPPPGAQLAYTVKFHTSGGLKLA